MVSFGILLIIQQLLFGQVDNDFFSIGAFGCENIPEAKSCGFNTVLFWYEDQTAVDRRMIQAGALGMKVILARAKLPNTPDITGISGGQRAVYESESKAFSHDRGKAIYDPAASHDTAWVICHRSKTLLQHDLWTAEQYLFQPISFKYYAYFRLKISKRIKKIAMCSLLVRRKVGDQIIIEGSRYLTADDFTRPGEYYSFAVEFDLDPGQGDKMDYAVKYLGSGDSLYSDFVDVLDVVAYKLKHGAFDEDIRSIIDYYGQYPALYRYYMWDEPTYDQMWASGQVQNLLMQDNEYYRGGIQVLYRMDVLGRYFDSVKTKELLVDVYPLYGGTNYYGRTPVDGGVLFQERLKNMCDVLGAARHQVKSHPGTELWFMPQTFGHAITGPAYHWDRIWNSTLKYEDEGWWREPTPRELRCMIWLALAHGAQGILYYRYHSLKEHFDLQEYNGYRDDHWIVGLTDPSGRSKRPTWYTVRTLNQELATIGGVLTSLISDTVFCSNTTLPTHCFIKSISDTLMQIGTFHDKTHDYLIIVNRHCFPNDNINVKLRIRANEPIILYDCYSKETIKYRTTDTSSHYDFIVNLNPGQGRLFRVTPRK